MPKVADIAVFYGERSGGIRTYLDAGGLPRAIERARGAEPDQAAAEEFAAAHRWERAFTAELADLEALACR